MAAQWGKHPSNGLTVLWIMCCEAICVLMQEREQRSALLQSMLQVQLCGLRNKGTKHNLISAQDTVFFRWTEKIIY